MNFSTEELQVLVNILANNIVQTHELSPLFNKVKSELDKKINDEKEAQETMNIEG